MDRSGGAATFRFDSRTSRPERDEPAGFEVLLAQALRMAVGWGLEFGLSWVGGSDGGVELAVRGPTGRAWMKDVVAPAYGRAGWVPFGTPPTRSAWSPLLWARRTGRSLDPLPGPAEPGSGRWSDIVAAGLSALPPGVLVRWRVRPLGAPAAPDVSRPATVLQPVAEGHRALPVTVPERAALDAAIGHRWQPQWSITGTILGKHGRATVGVTELEAMIAASSRLPGRAGIEFVTARWGGWFGPPAFRASEEEVAALFPTPWTRVGCDPRSARGSPTTLALPLRPPDREPFLPLDLRHGRHLLVLGETGMGKSTLLLDLAGRAARHGAVVLLDPLGDSARRFVDRLGPSERERAVLIAPVVSPVGINAVPGRAGGAPRSADWAERARDDLVTALRRIRSARYDDATFWGPRLDELATLALDAAACYPRGTILDAQRVLESAQGRAGPVPPEARHAVEELRRRVADRPEEVDGTRRLFAEITRHSMLRRMLCEPAPRWSAAEALAPHRITVVSGEATLAGESVARSLLAVHLALLWTELVARTEPSKVFVVLDEVQWYAHESLGEMLRLGRRFNLHVWAATQSLSRLTPPLRDALLTNCADIVAFRGSPEEAREFARWTSRVRAEDLASLGVGQALLLLDKGRGVQWLHGGADRSSRRSIDDPWGELVDRSDRWVVPEDPDAAAPAFGATGGTPPHDPLRELVVLVWAGLLAVDPEPTVRVPLGALRRIADPEGRRVRDLGRRLADAGVRVDAGRADEGRFWSIRRDGFETLLSPAVAPAELERADAQWRRLIASGGEPAARKSH